MLSFKKAVKTKLRTVPSGRIGSLGNAPAGLVSAALPLDPSRGEPAPAIEPENKRKRFGHWVQKAARPGGAKANGEQHPNRINNEDLRENHSAPRAGQKNEPNARGVVST